LGDRSSLSERRPSRELEWRWQAAGGATSSLVKNPGKNWRAAHFGLSLPLGQVFAEECFGQSSRATGGRTLALSRGRSRSRLGTGSGTSNRALRSGSATSDNRSE